MNTFNTPASNDAPFHPPKTSLDPRVSEILPSFLEHLKVEQGASAGTLVRYQRHIERLMEERGDLPMSRITSETVSLLKRNLMDSGLGPASIAAQISCLRAFLKFARDVKRLDVFDPDKLRRPKIPKRPVDYLTKEEIDRFFNAIPTHTLPGLRDRALVEVLYATGMRISEVLGLNRSDLDWELQEARIVGKGQKTRKVYFNEEALAWLRRYLDHRFDDNPALFVTQGAEPERMRQHGTWKRFHRYAAKAGLGKDVYPHMLRHTMATTLLSNGCPIGHIKAMLGHEHLQTTCKYYLGVISDAEVKKAHAKYISYKESDENQKTDEISPGQENTQTDPLTDQGDAVNSIP